MVRVALYSIVLASCLVAAEGALSVAAAAPAKPLVIIFANPPEESAPRAGVQATEQSPDGLLNAQRTQIATRAVRDRFGESTVAEAILYTPDAPVFLRATLEAKLRLKNPALPTEADRLALGKAIGAVSLVSVRAQPIKDKPGSVEVLLDSLEVASGKTWSDKIRAGSSLISTLPEAPNVEGGNQKPPVDNTAWMTASNTLVMRYLAGPLGEYTRALAPPGMINIPRPAETASVTQAPPLAPVAPAPTASISPAGPNPAVPGPIVSRPPETISTAQNQAIQNARQQSDALIASGDPNSAIVVLRKAVNQAPLSLALRASLAKAYLSAGRTNDAAAEARRALTVAAPDTDRAAWADITRVLASASTEIGDNKAAKTAYEEILKTDPQAHWARLALGDLLLAQGDTANAEKEYRAVRESDPSNREAVLSVARILMARGDFTGAIATVISAKDIKQSPEERLATNSILFDEIAVKTADSVAQNRQAFDGGQLSREAFYKATQAQLARVDSLLALLRSQEPATGSPEGIRSPYRHRIAASALLSQSIGSMLTFLESDDKKAGEQAKLLLSEFRKEMAAASS